MQKHLSKTSLNLRLGLKIQMIGFGFYLKKTTLFQCSKNPKVGITTVLMLKIRYSVFISNTASLKFYSQASSSEAIHSGALR